MKGVNSMKTKENPRLVDRGLEGKGYCGWLLRGNRGQLLIADKLRDPGKACLGGLEVVNELYLLIRAQHSQRINPLAALCTYRGNCIGLSLKLRSFGIIAVLTQ